MIVLNDDQMVIMDVETKIVGKYNTSVYTGRYIRNNKGYWYRVDIEWGHLKRIRYVSQVEKLNALVAQYQSVGKSG